MRADDAANDGILESAEDDEQGYPWLYTAVDLFTQCVMFMALIATFGSSFLSQPPEPPKPLDPKKTVLLPKKLDKVDRDRQILEKLLKSDAGKMLTLRKQQGRLALLLRDRVFFESGKAELKPAAQQTIQHVGALLAKMSCQLWVAGYTDNIPIKTAKYASNWVLATARAISVLKILQASGIKPNRLAAAGYGKYRARFPNNSEKNRAANRRVEISLVYR